MILEKMSVYGSIVNNVELDKLFAKTLHVLVKESSSLLSRKCQLALTVEWTTIAPTLRKELTIRMTDENDPFFIYMLNLPEEDFQSLKTQQGLLVDFHSFPQKFIDLLELCLQEEHKDTPKFLLTLNTPAQLGTSGAQLDIIETNLFKHLTHLSLKVQPATDAFVKKYLASSLKQLKDEKSRLEGCLQGTRADLQQRLKQAQDALTAKTLELERTRSQCHAEIGSIGKRHTDEMKVEQDRLVKIHKEEEQRWDREKREMEIKHGRETQQLETRVAHLETQNKDLQEKLYKSESSCMELRSRLIAGEDELQKLRQKTQSMNKESQALDSQYHEQLRIIGQLKSRTVLLEQELRDKEQIYAKTQELLQNAQEHKRRLEESCEQKQTTLTKRENSLKILSEELNKGNEIIKKLQTEIRNYHTKLKLRSEISSKQEEVLSEKDAQLASSQSEILRLRQELKEKESTFEKVSSELEIAKQKMEGNDKQIKTNENVISWLNKQLNDVQMNQKKNFDPASTLSKQVMTSTPTFRPSVPLTMHRGATHPTYQPWQPPPLNTATPYTMTSPPVTQQQAVNHSVAADLQRPAGNGKGLQPKPSEQTARPANSVTGPKANKPRPTRLSAGNKS